VSTGTGSRAAGVLVALLILLLGSFLYQQWGPAGEPDPPEPTATPEPVVEVTPEPTPEREPPTLVDKTMPDPDRDDLRALVDLGRALTPGVMELPRMGEMAADDEDYDPVIEARQIFWHFEQTLLEADPLDPESWRAAQEQHSLRNEGASRRAEFLRRSGHPEAASELMLEWSRLNGIWQARAYGRPHRPGGGR